MTVEEYFAHCYEVPQILPNLPLADEKFLVKWRETQDDAINFLSELYGRELNLRGTIKISFAQTLAGKLPVIDTENHDDFTILAAWLMNREKKVLPETVNAFTIPAQINGEQHRIILLNRAPYSNIPAEKLSLTAQDWLKKSKPTSSCVRPLQVLHHLPWPLNDQTCQSFQLLPINASPTN